MLQPPSAQSSYAALLGNAVRSYHAMYSSMTLLLPVTIFSIAAPPLGTPQRLRHAFTPPPP